LKADIPLFPLKGESGLASTGRHTKQNEIFFAKFPGDSKILDNHLCRGKFPCGYSREK
jgi:hypothetical protein